MKRLNIAIVSVCVLCASLPITAGAQRRGGGGARGGGGMSRGGGGMSRGTTRTSVTRPSGGSGSFSRPAAPATRPSAPASRPSAPIAGRGGGQPATRPGRNPGDNLGGGANIGGRENRPGGDRTNIGNGDRPINIQDNDIVAGGGRWDYSHGCCYGWGAAAAGFVAGAAIGSLVYSLPPGCPAYAYSGVTYNHCGGVWYSPQFEGTETTYIVVETPPGAPPDTAAPPPASAPPQ